MSWRWQQQRQRSPWQQRQQQRQRSPWQQRQHHDWTEEDVGWQEALRRSTKMLLVVKNPWLDLILAKDKTWEIRDAQTKQRGKIHLALSGAGGRIVGQCCITDSFAVDQSVLKKTYSKHRIKDLAVIKYRRPHAWVLTKARRYKKPFVYSHPRGANKWVKL